MELNDSVRLVTNTQDVKLRTDLFNENARTCRCPMNGALKGTFCLLSALNYACDIRTDALLLQHYVLYLSITGNRDDNQPAICK